MATRTAQRARRSKPRRYKRQEINGAAAGPSGDAAASRGATSGGGGARWQKVGGPSGSPRGKTRGYRWA